MKRADYLLYQRAIKQRGHAYFTADEADVAARLEALDQRFADEEYMFVDMDLDFYEGLKT